MISQETIGNTLQLLNAIKNELDEGRQVFTSLIHKKYHVSSGRFISAVRLGYFKKLQDGRYVCTMDKFEPIHVRHVIEEEYKKQNVYNLNYKMKRKSNHINHLSSDEIIAQLRLLINKLREDNYEVNIEISKKIIIEI